MKKEEKIVTVTCDICGSKMRGEPYSHANVGGVEYPDLCYACDKKLVECVEVLQGKHKGKGAIRLDGRKNDA